MIWFVIFLAFVSLLILDILITLSQKVYVLVYPVYLIFYLPATMMFYSLTRALHTVLGRMVVKALVAQSTKHLVAGCDGIVQLKSSMVSRGGT